MSNSATPNLPSRNVDKTSEFYKALGFSERWHDGSWMILEHGDLVLEFFPFPDLDPLTSSFGCCLRLDDLDAFYTVCNDAGLPERSIGQPRLHAPVLQPWGARMGALIDLDGTLVRLIQN